MNRFLCRTLLTFTLLAGSVAAAMAQDVTVQQNRKAQLEKEIAIIDSQLAENASKSRSALSQLSLVKKKIANRKELVARSDREIRGYSDRIYKTQRQINTYQARVDTLSAYYARLVKGAYKNRDAKIWYMYILASEDLGQAFRRYSYFRTLSVQMKGQAEKIRLAQADLEAEKTNLQALKKEAEALRAEHQKEVAALAKEEQQASSIVSVLNRNKAKYQKELAVKKQQVDALDREIRRLVEAAMKQPSGGSSSSKKPVDYKLASDFFANKGKLPWPADGPVVDHFGRQNHPTLKLPFSNGINIALSAGTEIKSVFDGLVKQIIVMPGYNQCVLVQHGNYFSFYCKLKSTSVKPGDTVKTGQVIGVVDTINGETHLHLQIWKNLTPQNPELWLR